MKTPEELAKEWGNTQPLISFDNQDRQQIQRAYDCSRQGHATSFLAGYQAAKDQLADTSKVVNGETSDGYHTFNELYEHRHALFIALAFSLKSQGRTWIAKRHQDGTCYDGYFIAGILLPTGTITYHLPDRLWRHCVAANCKFLFQAPKWDGHTSSDVIYRLKRYSAGLIDEIQPPWQPLPEPPKEEK